MRRIPIILRPVRLAPLALATLGCGSFDLPEGPPDVEQVTLQIEAVPADVGCVRLTATGPGRTVTREVEAKPGGAIVESFGGLPVGMVVFKAEAFGTPCQPVTRSTTPGWVSEEESVNVALGRLSSVALMLHRNGRAKVTVGFAEDPTVGTSGADGG